MINALLNDALVVIAWSLALVFTGGAIGLVTIFACEIYQEYFKPRRW